MKSKLVLIILRGAGAGCFFLITLFITNFFPVSEVGRFDLGRSILLLFGSITALGMDKSILQYAGVFRNRNRLSEIKSFYSKMILITILLGITLNLILAVVPDKFINSILNDNNSYKDLSLIFITIVFYAVSLINTEVFRVFHKHFLSEFYRGLVKFLIFIALVISIYFAHLFAYVLEAFLLTFLILSLITSIHLYFIFSKAGTLTKVSYSSILKTSSPMALSGLGFFLILCIDLIFIKKYYGDVDVAIYSQPVKIVGLIALIQTTLHSSMSSDIAQLHDSKHYKKLNLFIKKQTRHIFYMSVPVLILFVSLNPIILSFFGKQYEAGSSVFYILLGGSLINALCGCTSVYMNMTGKQLMLQNIILITVAINLLLNLILVPKYGIEGAAVASMISVIFWNITVVFYIYFKERILLILN